MKPNPGPGKLIVIEGLDGAGTTTQAHLLGQHLAAQGPIWVTWEPSDRPAGLLIRRILAGDTVADPRALALLFAADRLDHLYGPAGVLERLRRGEHVVCDRYYLSSLAYQTLQAPFSWVYTINSRALRPDLTLFLDVPVAACLERIGGRQGDRQELFERQEALEQVRASYEQAIRRLGRREMIQVVDGCGPISYVADLLSARALALLDPDLCTDPRAQRRLARREGWSFFPLLAHMLPASGLFLRGLRREADGVTIEVDTPGDLYPLQARLTAAGQVVPRPSDAAVRRPEADVLEQLLGRALREASHG